MKRTARTLITLAMVGVVAATTAACSTRANSDEIILYYAAGAGDNKEFRECIKPGEAGTYPFDDEIYSLPTNQRTWNIRPEGGDSKVPITSGSKPSADGQPGPSVSIYATADFFINVDCAGGKTSPVVQFWERAGRRYEISANGENGFSNKNWIKMMMNTLVPAEEKALREQTMRYSADELDANLGGVWSKIEAQLGNTFMVELKSKLGGEFFCGTGYAGGRKTTWDETVVNADGTTAKRKAEGTCPPIRVSISDINFTDPGIAEARNKVYKAKAESEAALIAARAEVDKAALLSKAAADGAYLRMKEIEAQLEAAKACAANPNCTIIVGADGVMVGAK
jgi:hypothetical protein